MIKVTCGGGQARIRITCSLYTCCTIAAVTLIEEYPLRMGTKCWETYWYVMKIIYSERGKLRNRSAVFAPSRM
jgi:hypothetical protein